MRRCDLCGGPVLGNALCIICKDPFYKRHPGQITCASRECKRKRNLQMATAWQKRLEKFPNEYVICKVCGDEVKKIRSNQTTCLSRECQKKNGENKKFRDREPEYVYRNLGQI